MASTYINILTFFPAYALTFYLAFFMPFYLALFLASSCILFGIYFDILCGILSGIFWDPFWQSFYLASSLTHTHNSDNIVSDISSECIYGRHTYSDILFVTVLLPFFLTFFHLVILNMVILLEIAWTLEASKASLRGRFLKTNISRVKDPLQIQVSVQDPWYHNIS